MFATTNILATTSVANYAWITMEKCDFLFFLCFLDCSEVNQTHMSSSIFEDYNRNYHFWHHNVVENEAHFGLEFPSITPLEEGFSSSSSLYYFYFIILCYQENLKSFFQLDPQVDLHFYLMEANALYSSRESNFLTPF